MVNLNLLLSGFLLLLDIKEDLLTERKTLRRINGSERIDTRYPFYQNPVINKNTPDPGVIRLLNGSGWALVCTSSFASRSSRSSAFPIYFSKGEIRTHAYKVSEWTF